MPRLAQPLEWKRPRMIFVNLMSDLFHKNIPKAHIAAVFDTMEKAKRVGRRIVAAPKGDRLKFGVSPLSETADTIVGIPP